MKKIFFNTIFWIAFIYAFWVILFKYAPDFTKPLVLFAGPIAGMLALLYAALKTREIMSVDFGNEKMKGLSDIIYKGAMTFLKKEYGIMSVFISVVFILLFCFINLETGLCFLTGALMSALAGVIGMIVSTKSNARAASQAEKSLNGAFQVAFSGGLVMGLCVTGFAMVALPVLFYIFKDMEIINGFALGASSVALFARVGGGIFTKAADVGADLVGKVEEHIPEDDPRNPAVIADNVGDNVGDVAGMGADLFESYVGSIIASMVLGGQILDLLGVFFPLTLAAIGILCSILGSVFVRTKENGNPMMSLQTGTVISIGLFVIVSYFLTTKIMLSEYEGIFPAVLIGVIAGGLLGFVTQYYTSPAYAPVKSIAQSTVTGAATTVISGVRVGMVSTFIPLVIICLAAIGAFVVIGGLKSSYSAGVYGVSLAAVGMLSTVGMIIAVDAYGPIADNAGGIAQMAGMAPEVRQRTDKLDVIGNTTAAIGKGFAIGSAALTAISLLVAYAMTVKLETINILNPFVLCAILFGACLPFLFCALSMGAVGRAAEKMVNEVRRQFRGNPDILTGNAPPDYESCIKISAKSAITEMIIPGITAIIAPAAIGFGTSYFVDKTCGAQALGGMLTGAIASGVCLAIMMANSGGAWDNAKKLIEEGNFGGKGSISHECAVIGDTVGDPFKDTSGPSLNILIKLMSITALVLAGLFAA